MRFLSGKAGFTRVEWYEVYLRWRDWQKGIPPNREGGGRGRQNPALLAAFAALDRAEEKAQAGQRDERGKRKR